MLLTILKKRQRRASARLCWRERHPKVSSMSETLALVSKLQLVQRQLAVGLSQSGLSYLYDGDPKWQQHIQAAAGPG